MLQKVVTFLLTVFLTALSLTASLIISYGLYSAFTSYKLGGGLASLSVTKTTYENLFVHNATLEDKEDIVHAFQGIEYPTEEFQVNVVIVDGLRGADGMFDPLTRKIYLQRGKDFRYTLAHEIGHLLEVTQTDRGSRELYAQLRGLPPDAEWGGAYRGGSDWRSKASEDFAEVFANLFVAASNPGDIGTYYGIVDNEPKLRQYFLSLLD